MSTPVALSLGSNLAPRENLRVAVHALRARFPGARISTVYQFAAVGFAGPDFLNAAALIDSDLEPAALSDWLHALEDAQGRDRSGPRFGNRSLDLDIVLFGARVLHGEHHLQIPRDELRHAFVLKPLAEIAPAMTDPSTGRTLARMWHEHPQRDVVFDAVSLD